MLAKGRVCLEWTIEEEEEDSVEAQRSATATEAIVCPTIFPPVLLLGGEAHWNLKELHPEAYEEANVSRIKGGLWLKLCCTVQPHPEE